MVTSDERPKKKQAVEYMNLDGTYDVMVSNSCRLGGNPGDAIQIKVQFEMIR